MQKIDFTRKPGQYQYEQTDLGKHASGIVKVGATSDRDPAAQRAAGGQDRQPDDHGGHLIAHSLGGRNDETNLDPQNANVNQIGQRHVEQNVAQLAQDPNNTVYMDVQNYNSPDSLRPDATMITVAVQNNTTGQIDMQHYSLQNASYEEQAQWDAIALEAAAADPQQDAGLTEEQRALANEYAEEGYGNDGLGTGFTAFFDKDSMPISSLDIHTMDDGADLGSRSMTAAADLDDGAALGSENTVTAENTMDDGASLGSEHSDHSPSTSAEQDSGMDNE